MKAMKRDANGDNNQKWEHVSAVFDLADQRQDIERTPVYGGWLVRVRTPKFMLTGLRVDGDPDTRDGSTEIHVYNEEEMDAWDYAVTFVPDPTHLWPIDEDYSK